VQVKDVIRAFAREYPHSPAAIVARLNDFVCDTHRFDDHGQEGFVCLCLAILDPRTGEGAVVTAGCEPPLVLRVAGSGQAEVLGVPGLPLGIEPQQVYQAPPLLLRAGDTLLMATDGITEARSPRREYLGYEGMVALAKDAAASPTLRHLGRAILDGARAFGGGSLHDDACLLLARRV
jgi:serine phosphatase RsbU (regulator of sigma subunit)